MKSKNKNFFILYIISVIFCYSNIFSSDIYHSAGTCGAQFLKIGLGARSEAIAGAYTSITGDNYNMYYNPAGLVDVNSKSITGHHNEWLTDIKYEFLGYSFKLNKFDALGISVMYLHMGDIDRTDDYGNPAGKFTAEDMAVNLSYAYNYNEDLYFGISGKYIKQSNAGYNANGYAVDLGVIANYFKSNGVTFGASILNIGPEIKFIKDSDKLPLTWRTGLSYNFKKMVLLSFDIVKPRDNNIAEKIGIEYNVNHIAFLRAGYNSDDDISNGYSYGVGFKLKNVTVDYAFVPQDFFGDSHRFSLTYDW